MCWKTGNIWQKIWKKCKSEELSEVVIFNCQAGCCRPGLMFACIKHGGCRLQVLELLACCSNLKADWGPHWGEVLHYSVDVWLHFSVDWCLHFNVGKSLECLKCLQSYNVAECNILAQTGLSSTLLFSTLIYSSLLYSSQTQFALTPLGSLTLAHNRE